MVDFVLINVALNVINKNDEISIDEWVNFSNHLNIRLKKTLIKGLQMNY